MSDFKKDFGSNLRRRIGLNDMTQLKFSEKVGVTNQMVSAWVIGRTTPNISRLKTIAEALNCKPYELFLSPVDNKSF